MRSNLSPETLAPCPPSDIERLTAILDRLHVLDSAAQPSNAQAAAAQIEANAVTDVRFLVTELWYLHHLRNAAEWMSRDMERFHPRDCPGCPICDCQINLDEQLAATKLSGTWPGQAKFWPTLKRDDNLLTF